MYGVCSHPTKAREMMIMNMTRNLPGIEIGVMSPYLRAAESVHLSRRQERTAARAPAYPRACARASALARRPCIRTKRAR